ncbi:MAG TPA: MarR family transcriptional regulator [Candidatus Saccharimonadales bacterium]|nr:MarR family transcriptional regulator [Candidatus Saccharimonadales bacterium]
MSSHKPLREECIARINRAGQDNGNLNVLLVNAIAQKIGLSATEFECWSYILDHGPFTAGQLAKKCGITTGGMTGVIDRLERGGFVRRQADPDDRRRVLVEGVAEEATRQKITELYRPLAEGFAVLTKDYTDEELAVITDFLQKANVLFQQSLDQLSDERTHK